MQCGSTEAALERLVTAGCWSWDITTDSICWTPELSRIYGLAPDEAPSGYDGFLALIHPLDRTRTRLEVERAMRDANDIEYQHRIVRADGQVRVLRSALYVATDDVGQVVQLSGACQDITEQASLRDDLDRMRGLATSGVVAAGLAHDLNNLVGALTLSARLVADGRDQSQTRDAAKLIHRAAHRVTQIARRIQELAHPGSVERRRLDVAIELGRIATALESTLPPHVALVTDIARVGAIVANETDLGRVVWNLVVNARDAIPDGGTISIATERVDVADGRYARVTVTDDGTGMDELTQGRLFDQFYSSKAATGRGLGLAIVKGIVEGAGGFVAVESTVGEGTRMHVHLPIAPD